MNRTGWNRWRGLPLLAGLVVAIALPLAAPAAGDDEVITREVRKELRRMIQEEGILDAAVERGIERFVRKQQALAKARKGGDRARNMRPVSPQRDHVNGRPEAPVTLVEYSDFECPFCKRFHPTVKRLLAANGDKVNWVYRHFPLAFHNPGAQKQAEASECAAELGGNDAFWRYSDLIYARTRSNGNGFPLTGLVPLAGEIGLEEEAFRRCLESGRMAARVQEDYEDGVKAGISGTPGVILVDNRSGRLLTVPGAVPLERLQAALDRLLAAGDGG